MQIASLAAFTAVVRAVSAQADVVKALAENAVLLAFAAGFNEVALCTDEACRHETTVAQTEERIW